MYEMTRCIVSLVKDVCFTKNFQVPNGGTEPYKAILGWLFPYISRIHTAYIGEDSSILRTWNWRMYDQE